MATRSEGAITVYAKDSAEWRDWLEKNSGSMKEVWLLFYRKGCGRPVLAYEDAVEQALCFGWIDGRVKKLDEHRYVRRFTPRKLASRWSALNLKRARKMIQEGKMTSAGLAARGTRSQPTRQTPPLPTELPRDLQEQFRRNSQAWDNFCRFPPSYRRITIGWVASARKEETQSKRLRQLMEFSAANKRIEFM